MYEVIVAGGGPAGLSAALVLGRQRRRVLVIDAGRPRNAPAAEMHMYLGRDGGSPARLLADGRAELSAYPTVELWQGRASTAGGQAGAFTVALEDGRSAQAARLMLASGQVDVPLDIPGLAERWGASVFHCPFCHGYETNGKVLAVIGNGFDAMLAAYVADRYSTDVVLCTHGPSSLPEPVAAVLKARSIPVIETPVAAIEGEPDGLTIRFADGTALERQAVYHRAPTRPNNDLAVQLGCELLPDGCVKVNEYGRTTVAGVYAAGDLAHLEAVPEPVTLVGPSAADGVRAAVWLEQELFRAGLPVDLTAS
ncbi:pyridine nucleotide-disulfide oxidoreductase [Planomonospora sphaerica]|uniref:Pyridine nucleotide-disulfide oxidoreductase n=1 Tax=Planomonospora sphaerica TaxID=161355 RepID=A0A161LKQ7_9ACTN|nr:NAD(P)/FAD-dependent oxidoreductase [Planomonospora sphaerica]GAT67395.1 pyridine nucleotide-disulfide oxidoreductase [Planomonospora sphaerica]